MKSHDRPRQCIKKQRYHFAYRDPYSQSYGFSRSHVRIWELDHKEGWASKNWCLQIVVLEKILESPLGCSESKPVSPKGSQPRIFTGRMDVQRPWGSNGNESTMIRTLSQWGRAENRLVQAGLYRAFCTLGKSLLSLNATGSHWRDSQERTRQAVGKGKPGARLQYLRGQAPSALDFVHCLQEATRAPSHSYSSITAVVFFPIPFLFLLENFL